ncbi:lactoferrin/transferrin family TonB-dependent receptor [Neisseria montereyensis]|uniref:Lactoferrin/transferrin family TonB-dependent receptor n=1 Tax=Neisseria montereyensis TaxID=2973938 RepID=A0ABT2FFA4_9NEIS|nr:lactoferrin/transferrin family TonB-dependent receptor [Neisseria montereyensis]MCS4534620.1 lactoferrin/transferrin family TonB-dependent receptor [Neisseria montereyensis]
MYMTYPQRKPKIIIAALAVCFASFPAIAADPVDSTAELGTVRVNAAKRITRRTQEVTGLGKIVKQAEDLEKEQIINIRDLVRYDPGISVVEQGRGGSSGFSIRGVDKNRVLISVDGIPQLQSYADTTSQSGGTGSMNEVEFENISAIEINKGSNSAEVGSGSLGGSVSYYTKNVSDFVPEGDNWGLTSKSVYSSRDKRFAQTIGGGFSYNGFEGLLQYTHREGDEIGVHHDAGNINQSFFRQDAYVDTYDLRGQPNQPADNFFRFEDCTDADCVKHRSALTSDRLWQPDSRIQPYTPEEERQRTELMRHPKETLSADEYTGENRIKPNPMEYKSGSWLARLGYHITPEHYVGWLLERTRQSYDSRDMRYAAYYEPGTDMYDIGRLPRLDKYAGDPKFNGANNSNGIWRNDPREGFANLLWTRARFLEEEHTKLRNGFSYRYTPQNSDSWADNFEFNVDRQNIKMKSATIYANCSPYPSYGTTLNCSPDLDKAGSYLSREDVDYKEKHLLFSTKWNKKLDWGFSKHDLNIGAGYDDFDSDFNKVIEETTVYKRQDFVGFENRVIDGQTQRIDIYRDLGNVADTVYPCTDWGIPTCSREPIKGKSYYLSLRDNMSLGKYVDLGLGYRIDRHSFHSDDTAIRSKTYTNRSWNTGLVIKPTPRWAISYRISNGFRVPSFQELYGYNVPGVPRDSRFHYIADLEPEKSRNQELGVAFRGDFGNIELSAFRSKYRDLIAHAITKADENGYNDIGNFNVQNADLEGINISSIIDLNGLWSKLPEGLSLNLAYNRIRAKRLFNNTPDRFTWLADYPLETIQPSRYVVGLNYDAPSEKWGISANLIHSRGKDPKELISKAYSGSGLTFNQAATNAATKPWTTLDLIGYLRPWKNATLRAGVYNLMNYRYLTWETVRQTSINSLARQVPGSDYKQFAAPGRNVTLSFEMKF